MINLGEQPLNNIMLGADAVDRAYYGEALIWPSDGMPLIWPGVQAWFRADAPWTMNLDSNGKVISWADCKNGFVVSQPSAANRPEYQPTGFNGTPGVKFTRALQTYLSSELLPWVTGNTQSGIICVIDQQTPPSFTPSTTIVSYGSGPVGQRKAQRLVRYGSNRGGLAVGNGWTEGPYYNPRVDYTGRHSTMAWFKDVASIANIDESEFAGVSSFAVRTPLTGRTRIGCDCLDVPSEFCDAVIRDVIIIRPSDMASEQEFFDYLTWSYARSMQ